MLQAGHRLRPESREGAEPVGGDEECPSLEGGEEAKGTLQAASVRLGALSLRPSVLDPRPLSTRCLLVRLLVI